MLFSFLKVKYLKGKSLGFKWYRSRRVSRSSIVESFDTIWQLCRHACMHACNWNAVVADGSCFDLLLNEESSSGCGICVNFAYYCLSVLRNMNSELTNSSFRFVHVSKGQIDNLSGCYWPWFNLASNIG